MAKKRVATSSRRRSGAARDQADGESSQDAADALDRARETLRQAEIAYQRALQESTSDDERESAALTVGDILDGTLEFARQHPATGLLAAGVIGFLLGRSTSR